MIKILVGILVVVVVAVLVYPAISTLHIDAKHGKAMAELATIRVALLAHKSEYHTFPTGDIVGIWNTLSGSNANKVSFAEGIPTNANGQITDPWGTVYRIECVSPANVRVLSAGRDHKWGTRDDLMKQ